MTFKALLVASIFLAPALAHAEGHANLKHTYNLQRCHNLTSAEIVLYGKACRASLFRLGWKGDFVRVNGVLWPNIPRGYLKTEAQAKAMFATPDTTVMPGISEDTDLSDNKNELPNRGTAHGQSAPAAHAATAGTLGQSYAYRAAQGTLSAEQIGTVTEATLHNAMITRANQAAYVAAHPPVHAAVAVDAVTHAVAPPSPSVPPSVAPPAPSVPSKPSTPPSVPSKPSTPAAPPSAPPPSNPPPSNPPPSNPPPSNPPPSNPPPSNPPPHNPPHHPAPPPSHPGNPGKGGKGCSGRGK